MLYSAVALENFEAFDRELAQAHMRGQWQVGRLLQNALAGPTPAGLPFLWKWQDVYDKLLKACEVMPESHTARRNLAFLNPGFQPGRGVTTHTITAGMQIVKPREVAEAHRHTIAALRLAIQGGPGLHTVVDGRACAMESYDLIFTPAWSWHDHHNDTDEPAVWMDVLDSPLVIGLNQVFFEDYAGGTQPVVSRDTAAPLRFAWRNTERQLREARPASASPYDGTTLQFLDARGVSPLPALGSWVQRLNPGQETRAHRHTSSSVHFVIRGEGTTVAGDRELAWSRHDSFAVPNWIEHRHINRSRTDEAILFTVTDIPLLMSLGLYREEPENSLTTIGRVA
jgi:1-hydroxy-2-naphthoate dioxygenase